MDHFQASLDRRAAAVTHTRITFSQNPKQLEVVRVRHLGPGFRFCYNVPAKRPSRFRLLGVRGHSPPWLALIPRESTVTPASAGLAPLRAPGGTSNKAGAGFFVSLTMEPASPERASPRNQICGLRHVVCRPYQVALVPRLGGEGSKLCLEGTSRGASFSWPS